MADFANNQIKETENFVTLFYKMIDFSRQYISNSFLPNAAIVWNGNPLPGGDALSQMFTVMPETLHEVCGLDVHTLPISFTNGTFNSNNNSSVSVSVSGKVRIGNERNKNIFGFSQMFILQSDYTGSYKIATCSYRLTHKPADSTVI